MQPEAALGIALKTHGLIIGTAESCTGGLVLHRLTNIPGSSAWVMGGIVAYDNIVKQHLLGVGVDTLQRYGAVSEQTAREMALGARSILKTDLVLSITGIAGPGGGTPEKPVGLTYIGLAGPGDQVMVERHIWPGDREAVKAASATAALNMALAFLKDYAS